MLWIPESLTSNIAHMFTVGARSQLIVASPPLDDSNFDRSVVYVIDHNDEGAIGVVINRPLADPDLEPITRWSDSLTEPPVIFNGGPVDPSALIALGVTQNSTEREIEGAVQVADRVWSIDLAGDPAVVAPHFAGIRIFSGYAGWSSGQLDAEIDAGGWIVLAAETNDVFGNQPADLWRRVLNRQPPPIKWLANAPGDISLN